MTSDANSSRSRAQDADVAIAVPRTDADTVNVDATVVPVAAGQATDGRHIAASMAPQGSFAAGQADEVAPK